MPEQTETDKARERRRPRARPSTVWSVCLHRRAAPLHALLALIALAAWPGRTSAQAQVEQDGAGRLEPGARQARSAGAATAIAGGVTLAAAGPATPATAGRTVAAASVSPAAVDRGGTDGSARAEELARDAELRLETIRQALAETGRRTRAFDARLKERRRLLQRRARLLYKASRGGLLRLAMEADGGEGLFARLSAAARIIRRDRDEMRAFGEELGRLTGERSVLLTRRAEQAALAARHGSYLTASKGAGEVRGDPARQARGAAGFAALRGRLARPVHAPFAAMGGGVVDRRSGVEIARLGLTFRPSARGAPVVAPSAGLVRNPGPFPGYGQLLLLDHGDGYLSVLGFLAEIAVAEGQRVAAGQRIGAAGIDPLTGSPGVYFELRHNERPLDAEAWLRAR